MVRRSAWAFSPTDAVSPITGHAKARAAIRRRFIATAIAAAFTVVGACPGGADAQEVCAEESLLTAATGSSQIPSPCIVPAGGFLVETLYYQNVSKVGGTTLAAYPSLQFASGIGRRADVVFDLPSQVAESGRNGAGIYPRSHSSYGLRYGFARMERVAFTAVIAVVPPASMYAPSETQPKYRLDITSAYQLGSSLTITGRSQGSTSHTAGVGRILPEQIVGADVAVGKSTVPSPDIGVRSVAARAHSQSFGDLCIKRLLYRKLMFDAGIGTAFNPVDHAKAHYISAGLSFQP
jgi:hypothetical protein